MKMNIEWKGWLAAMMTFASVAAFAVSGKEMRRLPAPEFADTEVTAHHRLDQTGGRTSGSSSTSSSRAS